ncbi:MULTISPECIES: DUF6921 family protein [unclassified Pyramidobacter]|uniref:DUF6921 family protein n=1 Tax=unclassified Pyramidobacter TaxID=2632171 RepID=UPI000EA09904|nr:MULTISPECIES: hypothetical protein [unclassified Pyramidobacter]RKJ81699.1 hypothetical protein D7D26_00325 [Pyramidobacter sp. CG50-2]WOL40902.1 hypothetical protein RAH42_04500 [Pyramidobacter sp. YE332]
MIKRAFIVAALTLCLIAGTGFYYRSRLDALSAASSGARRAHAGEKELDGLYLLAVNPRVDASGELLRGLREAALGRPARFGRPGELKLAYTTDEKALGVYARRLARRLERAGLNVKLSPCSPVMLRSKALAGKYDLFVTPRRVILMSDIGRLGALTLKAREMERAL